ncbi:MAG: hypothetical protein KBD46_02860, partial [Candidatus Levybacteria bacterium]|nr:hypothetical protein [Candidatus Levybacteria bacterium]
MITLIHGDDIASSRKYYKQLQKKDTTILDGEKVSSEEVVQTLQSDMLFADEKAIAFENFFSKRKPSKEMQAIIESLQKNAHLREIVFWESKPLTKKMIDTFP